MPTDPEQKTMPLALIAWEKRLGIAFGAPPVVTFDLIDMFRDLQLHYDKDVDRYYARNLEQCDCKI